MEVLVHVEISKNSRIKYELDKEYNMLICDRVLPTPFSFPFNYGFVPNTLSGDGDPLDVIIFMEESLEPNTLIKCRIIDALETIDETIGYERPRKKTSTSSTKLSPKPKPSQSKSDKKEGKKEESLSYKKQS